MTGEIVVVLILYLHGFILPLSLILSEHQNNNTTATLTVPVGSDNGKHHLCCLLHHYSHTNKALHILN